MSTYNQSHYYYFLLFKILSALAVIFGIGIIIFFIVVQPHSFKFYVTEAELTQFDYTNNTLHYNLVLNFTVRNPNEKLSIYYDKVEASAFYEGSRFASPDVITDMNSFGQCKKSTDTVSAVFAGQQMLLLDNDQVSDFNKDKSVGIYNIHVKLYFRIRFRVGDFITRTMKPKVKCDLKVPFINSNTTLTLFETTNCDVHF